MSLLPCLLRHWLWRLVCSLAGGLTVTGAWPRAQSHGRVVVANHASHADTAAILAALPATARPVFAAAADYWFDIPVRRFLVTSLIGALPVRRTEEGTYQALLDAAGPVLARGGTVVVYPEGTRSFDGQVAPFRSGAIRLAKDCGVPIVPVALLGTGDRLPKNGGFDPGPMEVRIGTPVSADETSPERLRAAVVALREDAPLHERRSRIWRAVASVVEWRHSWLIALGWGFAEALSWPIIAEMALVLFAVAAPRRMWPWCAGLVAGSVVGVLVTAVLASRGFLLPALLTTARMAAAAYADLDPGAPGMMCQALSGVPVKVFARAAGQHHLALPGLAFWTLVERGLRMSAVALVLWATARRAHPWLRRLYGLYLVAVAVLFTVGLAAVIETWS